MTNRELLDIAVNASKDAIAPFSNFKVGAALLTKSGKVYRGINIENSSYSATICAERVAFSKALSEGEKEFKAIAIVGGKENLEKECFPCGVCRQFMSDFVDKEFKIILGDEKDIVEYTFDQILPNSFKL